MIQHTYLSFVVSCHRQRSLVTFSLSPMRSSDYVKARISHLFINCCVGLSLRGMMVWVVYIVMHSVQDVPVYTARLVTCLYCIDFLDCLFTFYFQSFRVFHTSWWTFITSGLVFTFILWSIELKDVFIPFFLVWVYVSLFENPLFLVLFRFLWLYWR